MTTYHGVIFDLDGTLINSLEDLAHSTNQALTEFNLPTHPIESYKYKVGNGIRKLIQRALPQDQQDLLEPVLARFKEIYALHNLDHTAPYPGIVELLQQLESKGYRLGICTNKHEEAAKEIVRYFFPQINFSEVIGDKPGFPRKPDPGKVLTIAEHWNLKPQEIAYLGDSDVDMQTAVNAQMLPVGVLWGFRDREELLANGAKILLTEPLGLLQHI